VPSLDKHTRISEPISSSNGQQGMRRRTCRLSPYCEYPWTDAVGEAISPLDHVFECATLLRAVDDHLTTRDRR
jgi:hypothetical protein